MYAGIDQLVLREGFAASAVCDLLEVSRSGFYAWRSSQVSVREERDQELMPWIAVLGERQSALAGKRDEHENRHQDHGVFSRHR